MVNISLNSSMRSNLLSLQNVSRLQDIASNRLATGLKVNSALDNPSSFYSAQSLTNRASDLTALLDSMSQGVQTLKAVSVALDSASEFLQQARSIASTALEDTQPIAAKVSTEAELLAAINSGQRGLIVLTGNITMSKNQNLILNDGQSLVGAKFLDNTAAATTLTFNFDGQPLAGIELRGNSLLSDLNINLTTNKKNDTTSANDINGVISVTAPSAHVRLNNLDIASNTAADTSESVYSAVYGTGATVDLFGKITFRDGGARTDNIRTYGISGVKANINNDAVLNINTQGARSLAFYNASVNISKKGVVNISTSGEKSHTAFNSKLDIAGIFNAKIQGEGANIFYQGTATIRNTAQIAVDIKTGTSRLVSIGTMNWEAGSKMSYIHHSAGFSGNYSASISQSVQGIFADPVLMGWQKDSEFTGIADSVFTGWLNQPAPANSDKLSQGSLSAYERYRLVIENYDSLIRDSSYKGINLLRSDNLQIDFNETASSQITVKGVNATSAGLNLNTNSWTTSEDVSKSLVSIDEAINSLRGYSSAFGNYYNIISTREDFTNTLVNILEEGADKLTLADMNQESANMLALQTRQMLAVNSLSLAGQASQSVLKLF